MFKLRECNLSENYASLLILKTLIRHSSTRKERKRIIVIIFVFLFLIKVSNSFLNIEYSRVECGSNSELDQCPQWINATVWVWEYKLPLLQPYDEYWEHWTNSSPVVGFSTGTWIIFFYSKMFFYQYFAAIRYLFRFTALSCVL